MLSPVMLKCCKTINHEMFGVQGFQHQSTKSDLDTIQIRGIEKWCKGGRCSQMSHFLW